MQIYGMGSTSKATVSTTWACVTVCGFHDFSLFVWKWMGCCVNLLKEEGGGREGKPGVFPLFKVHSGICCCVYVLLKGVCQNVFTASCLVQYEGRNALPHPPINIIWTHISSHPSLMCCELQQSGHHNPNIRRLPAVKSGRAIWGQA